MLYRCCNGISGSFLEAMSERHTHRDPHEHSHGPMAPGRLARLAHRLRPHSHRAVDKVDSELETSRAGMRALWISLAVLGATAAVQAVVVVLSGSVALLGDTLHNIADAATALPLGMAFLLGRRTANRRYTYGYGRAEDLAGVVIVIVIAASAVAAGYQAVSRLLDPQPIDHVGAVAAAAVVGCAGNEWVARYRIHIGRRIGSAALVADGQHARTDGFASLGVLAAAAGAALGFPLADPLVGLLIAAAILLVLKEAARDVYHRLMDAVDPQLVHRAEEALSGVTGVLNVGELRLRWTGHRLRAEAAIVVDASCTVVEAHQIALDAEHQLIHTVPRLTTALVHTDPAPTSDHDHHEPLAHHVGAAGSR